MYYQVDYELARVDTVQLSAKLQSVARLDSVIIYPAGNQEMLLCRYLENIGITVECFCDRDAGTQTKSFYGKPVISFDKLYSHHAECFVVVSANDEEQQIFEELTLNGIKPSNIITVPVKDEPGYIRIPVDAMPDELQNKYIRVQPPKVNCCATHNETAPILVRTTVYNVKASYLRRAIESVLNQTYANFRYLIVDNGSTDGSADIINEYARKDSRIVVITNKQNIRGANWYESDYARRQWQKICEHMTTKYFCKLDSDDYYVPTFLESAFQLAEANDADIVAGQTVVYHEQNPENIRLVSNAPIDGPKTYVGQSEIANALLDHNFIFCVSWCKLVKTKYFRKEGGNLYATVGDLSDVSNNLLKVSKSNRVVMIDEIWHHHTWHDSGVSKNLSITTKPITSTLFVYSQLLAFLRQAEAENAPNAASLLEAYSFSRLDFDLKLLEKSVELQPDLVAKSVHDALVAEIPDSLKSDPRLDNVFAGLNEILQKANRYLSKGGAQ